MKGKPPNPLRDEIRAAYLAGERQTDISRRLGVTIKAVHWNIQDLRRDRSAKGPMMQIGRSGIKNNLTQQQKRTLETLAKEWGCETLSEAATEILRDYLDEDYQKKMAGRT
jgi:transposase